MKTTEKKHIATHQGWSGLYGKVVKEISQKESVSDRTVKDAFSEKIKDALKGKDLIIENSCNSY